MRGFFVALALGALAMTGCGGGGGPSGCFKPQPGHIYQDRSAVFVADTGSSSISVFQNPGPNDPVGGVCGSPFHVNAPPTALVGALAVVSAPGKSVSFYRVDPLTSKLTGPTLTITGPYTPVATASQNAHGGSWLYVANAEGSVSAYAVTSSAGGQTPTFTGIPGSPFPAGAGPSSLAWGPYPVPFVLVTNSKSNNISVFAVDDTTGVLTPAPGSPVPSGGAGPSSIAIGGFEFSGFGGPNGAPFAYVANAGSNNMSVFSYNFATGALTPVSGSPFTVGRSPQAIIYYQAPL